MQNNSATWQLCKNMMHVYINLVSSAIFLLKEEGEKEVKIAFILHFFQ